MVGSAAACLVVLPMVLCGREYEYTLNMIFEAWVAKSARHLFIGPMKVVNASNIGSVGGKGCKPAIYIANHGSMVDIMMLYELNVNFVWISKKAVALMPGVGQIMYLSGHVLLDRGGRESVKQMFRKCNEKLTNGRNIFIFPQGTRDRITSPPLPFKHGAFSIALNHPNGPVDVIPVSIDIVPKCWTQNIPFLSAITGKNCATITVHPKMDTKKYLDMGEDGKKVMMEESREIIYSVFGGTGEGKKKE